MAEDERRRRTCVEDSIENSGSSTATDKPYQCSVCERAFCDLVCHLQQRSIIRWAASFQGQGQGVCANKYSCYVTLLLKKLLHKVNISAK